MTETVTPAQDPTARSSRLRSAKHGLSFVVVLILLFVIYCVVTLARPTVMYGDPNRPLSGPGATLPPVTSDAGDWSSFGHDPGGSQSSPLAQIDAGNVAQLQQVWINHSGDFREGDAIHGTKLEGIPLEIAGTVYQCTPFDRIQAIDATTGQQRWAFDPHTAIVDGKRMITAEMKPKHCRGLAYWHDATAAKPALCTSRIFRAAGDTDVFGVDAATGQPCPDFGAGKGHPGFVSHHDYDNRGEGAVGGSAPPIVVGNVLVSSFGTMDSLTDAADGIVRGFDVRTGKLLWEFDPIPPEHAHDTGAANVWSLLTADPARHMVFLATTEPSPDFFGGGRQFDVPLANAVVAISSDTGKVIWHYQIVRHDIFDYDLPSAPLAVTIRKDGQLRDVLIQQTKMGTLFVLDRDTGQSLFPIKEYPAPRSTVPGEHSAPTQPMPVLPESFSGPRLQRARLFGLTPVDRGWCKRRFDAMRYDGVFTPPDARESLTFPSSLGGGNWGGAAYDPTTNLLIVKSNDIGSSISMRPQTVKDGVAPPDWMTRVIPGKHLQTGGSDFVSPVGIPCTPPPWGTLTAVDMSSGHKVWQVPLGQSYRWGVTVPAWLHWGSPSIGGPMITAGGIVFSAGSLDQKIRAYDVKTGRVLWQAKLPAPGMSVPTTYMVGGRQYVVISAGGNSLAGTKLSDALVAFALPRR